MQIVEIEDGVSGAAARIAVDYGFNCFEFNAVVNGETVHVLHAAEGFSEGGHPPSHSGIPLLFPYPNRIRSGRYSWDGKEYELPESLVAYEGAGNAIHGFCLDRPWRIAEQTSASVTGVFQMSVDAPDRLPLWPADGEIRVRYEIKGNCLHSEIEVRNPADAPLPWGFGTHAYFRLPLTTDSRSDECTVYAPVTKKWALDECLPSGQLIDPPENGRLIESPVLASLKLDDVYTGVQSEDGVVTCRLRDQGSGVQVVQRCDDSFREIVAFTPPWASAVCLEPYTCTTDAINLQQKQIDAGLKVLEPGGTWRGWIDIDVSSI